MESAICYSVLINRKTFLLWRDIYFVIGNIYIDVYHKYCGAKSGLKIVHSKRLITCGNISYMLTRISFNIIFHTSDSDCYNMSARLYKILTNRFLFWFISFEEKICFSLCVKETLWCDRCLSLCESFFNFYIKVKYSHHLHVFHLSHLFH